MVSLCDHWCLDFSGTAESLWMAFTGHTQTLQETWTLKVGIREEKIRGVVIPHSLV